MFPTVKRTDLGVCFLSSYHTIPLRVRQKLLFFLFSLCWSEKYTLIHNEIILGQFSRVVWPSSTMDLRGKLLKGIKTHMLSVKIQACVGLVMENMCHNFIQHSGTCGSMTGRELEADTGRRWASSSQWRH